MICKRLIIFDGPLLSYRKLGLDIFGNLLYILTIKIFALQSICLGGEQVKDKFVEINKMLVEVYDDINRIEEYSIKKGAFSDLSITEIHTINAVGMYGSKMMSEVAAELEITMGTLTTAVDKLIKKGYMERSRSNTDRRIVNVSLTKRGKLAYRIHEKFHLEMVQSVVEDFDPQEEEILLNALRKLNLHLKDIYLGAGKN